MNFKKNETKEMNLALVLLVSIIKLIGCITPALVICLAIYCGLFVPFLTFNSNYCHATKRYQVVCEIHGVIHSKNSVPIIKMAQIKESDALYDKFINGITYEENYYPLKSTSIGKLESIRQGLKEQAKNSKHLIASEINLMIKDIEILDDFLKFYEPEVVIDAAPKRVIEVLD